MQMKEIASCVGTSQGRMSGKKKKSFEVLLQRPNDSAVNISYFCVFRDESYVSLDHV